MVLLGVNHTISRPHHRVKEINFTRTASLRKPLVQPIPVLARLPIHQLDLLAGSVEGVAAKEIRQVPLYHEPAKARGNSAAGASFPDPAKNDDFVKSRQGRRHSKKLSRHRRGKARKS